MTDKEKALLAVADVANKYGILEGRAFDFADAAIAAYTKAVSGEPAEWSYKIQYGPDGEANYAWVYCGKEMVATMKTHHAIAVCQAFAAPQPPAGWKLVPVEPTYAMLLAARPAAPYVPDIYDAMLAAAPEPGE
jgi:hypothetical protein